MATVAELNVKIGAQAEGLKKELRAAEYQLKRFSKDMPSLVPDNAGTIMAGFGAAIALAAGKAVKLSAAMEMNKISFTTMLGSASEADAMLTKLATLAAGSPFGFTELTESSKKMLGLGVAAQDVLPWLTTIGDTVSAFGGGTVQVQSISDAFAKMLAQGTMAADQMNRLSDAGVPGWKLLAEVLNVDVATAMKMAENKSINASMAIQGMMDSMSTKYAGSMAKASNTVTGQLSNMGDVATQIATKMGDSISKGLDLTSGISAANKQLDAFAAKIDSVGVGKALADLVPDQAIVASMTLVAAVSASRFIPAMAQIAIMAGRAKVAMLAFNAAMGPVGWAITALTLAYTEFYLATDEVREKNEQASVAVSNVATNTYDLGTSMAKANPQAVDMAVNMYDIGTAANEAAIGVTEAANTINYATAAMRKFNATASEHRNVSTERELPETTPAVRGPMISSTSGVDKAAKAWEELQEKAKQVTDSIEKEWVQTTVSQIGQLDIWRKEQFAALAEIETKYAEQGETYEKAESDKAKIAATYSQRRIDIFKAEVEEIKKQQEKMDAARNEVSSYGKTGASAILADIETERQARIKAIRDAGFATIETNAMIDQVNEQSSQKATEMYQSTADIKAEIDAAYQANSMAQLQAALTAENAIRLNNYSAEQSMMETYQQAYLQAHATTAQLVADMYQTALDGVGTALSDVVMGVESGSKAIQNLGKSLLKTVVDYYAKQLAGKLMLAVFGEKTLAKETALSVAAAGVTAAAWAKAAAMVSLASFGANAAPAMAGITATVGLASALALVPMATGGIVTGPTTALIGEGANDEAVIPLNKRMFEKLGLTGGSSGGGPVELNMYGDINNTVDYANFWEDAGRTLVAAGR